MADYVYAVSSIKYGTPTGSNTMPSAGAMVTLPDTVKGTINIEEAEGVMTKFFVDQKRDPIKSLKTEEGDMTITAQFYDLTVGTLAALKGGTAVTGATNSYTPSTGYVQTEKAIEINFDSGHKLCMYNASIVARLIGKGGRDAMMMWELKATPQMSTDLAGSWILQKP